MPETNARAAEQIKALLAIIEAAVPHLRALEDTEQKAEHAQTQLAETLREYTEASKKLELVRGELAKAESDLRGKKHLIADEAARALAQTNRQIAARQEELRRLNQQKGN